MSTTAAKMDWFFNQWVYGTQVPAYRLEYNVTSDGVLTGKITQSGVIGRLRYARADLCRYG